MGKKYEKTKYPNLYINKVSGKYYWREFLRGREFFVSTREATIGRALTKMKELRQKAGQDSIIVLQKTYLFEDIFNGVLEIQKSKSHKTYLSARNQIDNYLRPWFKKNCPRIDYFMLDYEMVWAKYVKDHKKISDRKLEHDRRHLIMAIKRAENKQIIKRTLSKKDLPLKESTVSIGQYIEDQDINKILNLAKLYDGRLYLQILMALMMAMRKSEILQLKKEEISWKSNEIILDPARLKTRMQRKVGIPISDSLKILLRKFYDCSKGKYIFPATYRRLDGHPIDYNFSQVEISKSWRRIREELSLNYRFHDLRHTSITNMIERGIPLSTVSKVVGASERTINRIYDHIRVDVKKQISELFNDRFHIQ